MHELTLRQTDRVLNLDKSFYLSFLIVYRVKINKLINKEETYIRSHISLSYLKSNL
jgi:hypothetical protein